jgi:hypothetical protein
MPTGAMQHKRLVGHRKIHALQYGPSYHAMGVRGRLRFDRSLPRRRRKGSQVKR